MPKRVLVFAPYGSYRVHHQVDAVIGSALRVRGCEVTVILCDGLFENCPAAGQPASPTKCNTCARQGKDFFAGFPLETVQLRSLLAPEDLRDARAWADSLEAGQMPDAAFEGMQLGLWTDSTLHQYFLTGLLDHLDPAVARIHRGFLYNAALIVRGLGRAIESKRPDRMLCFSGFNAFYRVASEVAGRRGVLPLNHERGFIDDSFSLTESGFPHRDGTLARAWEHWRDIPLTEAECAVTRKYFEEREFGKNANWITYYTFTSDAESARKALRIPGGAKVVGLFTSSDWEVGMSMRHMEMTFESQIDWIRATARVCREEGVYLVIRHHPSIVLASRVAHRFITELEELAKEFPGNVRVVMPDEKITSYALLWTVDLAITLFTTLGAEAFIRGIPTICLGEYMYRHMGLEWIRHQKDYPESLRAAIKGADTVRPDKLKQAYRFAYLIFFRLSFRFKSFGIKDVHAPDIRISSAHDLAPGKDEVMDRVCDHILSGSPIYPQAGADRPADAADQEQACMEKVLADYGTKRREAKTAGWEAGEGREHLVSVLHLKQADRTAPYGLSSSLSRSRHGNLEYLPTRIPAGLAPRAAAAFLLEALAGCRGDFVHVGLDPVQIEESAYANALDAFEKAGAASVGAVFWGAWVADGEGSIRGEILSERSRETGFDAHVASHAFLGHPFALLSLGLWRKQVLRDFLVRLDAAHVETWEDAARKVFEKHATAEVAGRLAYPMAVIRSGDDFLDTPDRDLAWLMELSDRLPEAEATYRMVLRDDPGDRDTQRNLASLLERQGRGETALAADTGPVNPPPAHAKGHASYEEVAHLVEAVPGWLLEGQEKYLFDKVKALPEGARILEIGSFWGRSTTAMALACVGTSKRIYSIDTFCGNDSLMRLSPDFLSKWRANLAKNGLDAYVTPVQGYSYDVLPAWQGPTGFDFAFIDASHEYVDVVKDFQLVYPMMKTGGWMAFHDVEPGWPGSWRAWLEYGRALLTDHEAVATLACGRKAPGRAFDALGRPHAEFSFAREYRDFLAATYGQQAAALTDAMDRSLAGRYGTPQEMDALHTAELFIGRMPEFAPFRKTLRDMLRKDARLDGHLLLWNAMTLMTESKWEEAYRDLLEATRVSRPLPVSRIRNYCQVLKEQLGPAGKRLPEPGTPVLLAVSREASGNGPLAGQGSHYGQDYFNWQKHIGAFGGVANLFKFREHIRPEHTVVDLGSGGGFLLANIEAARKMGVEINPAARREASLHAGIDAVERPEDLPDDFADLVVSNHALEHTHSPLDVLKALLPKLKVGGKLVLVVPHEGPRQEWDPADINKHLFTWNPMTLGNLITLAGYKVHVVESIQHQWPPDFIQAWERLGEDGFHAAAREQARTSGTYQIRAVAERVPAEVNAPARQPATGGRPSLSPADLPVALMVYRRPAHTAKVLAALESLGARNVRIFADGAKSDQDRSDVEATRQLCRSQGRDVVASPANFGLARSIMRASDRMLADHDHFILLEDDCVPQRHFLDFMAKSLERYRDNESVFGISGYTVPLDAQLRRNYPHDAYFFPRIGSWGWATWRRAWQHLDRDLNRCYRAVLEAGIDIHQGGNDIQASVEGMLRDQVKDVWTLNWVLTVYAKRGFYLYPTESHVQNIGFDGTGVHCGATSKYDTPAAGKPAVSFPDRVEADPGITRTFRSFYDLR